MQSPGDTLIDLCAHALREVVLVAPYIKLQAVRRIIGAIPPSVETIVCVTRWRPEEVAAGVSDLEVFDEFAHRENARLLIHANLHAKYYRIDDRCLIGSANITHKALGWAVSSNLELLMEADVRSPYLAKFERNLLAGSFDATSELKNDIAAAAQAMSDMGGFPVSADSGAIGNAFPDHGQTAMWVPLCMRPELLYRIYANEDVESLVAWTVRAGQLDIAALKIPPGLGRSSFQSYAASAIYTSPLVGQIVSAQPGTISEAAGEQFLSTFLSEETQQYPIKDHWQVITQWLTYFLPRVFRTPYGSSDLQKGVEIGERRV